MHALWSRREAGALPRKGRHPGTLNASAFQYVERVPTVLITGASRGIGRATTMWLAARG
jgi:NADPH:quinone reductase-like Zn-dependent oxidoreductase